MSHLGRLEGEQPQLMTLQVTILPGLFSKFFLDGVFWDNFVTSAFQKSAGFGGQIWHADLGLAEGAIFVCLSFVGSACWFFQAKKLEFY